jgi:hypothetical protein
MAFVIWAVFLTDLMRRRMSRVLAMDQQELEILYLRACSLM